MKCPFKFGLMQFDGGEECDHECAWLVEAWAGMKPIRVCVTTLVGDMRESPRKAINFVEEDDG